jgi:hypothetical protein
MSLPPPVGKHRQPNPPRGWPGLPAADGEKNAARQMTNAQRNKRAIMAIVATVLLFAGYAGYRVASGGASDSGSAAATSPNKSDLFDWCYITLSGEVIEYVSVGMGNGQNCGTIAFAMQQEFYGATVSSDGSTKPWPAGYSAACMGTLTADNDPATVIAEGGDDTGDVCSTFGFSSTP